MGFAPHYLCKMHLNLALSYKVPNFGVSSDSAAVNVTSLLLGAKALQHLDLTVFVSPNEIGCLFHIDGCLSTAQVVAQALHAPFSIVCSRIFLGASATSSSVSSVLIIIAFGLVYVTEPGSRLWSMTIAAVSALARAFEPACVKRAERTLGEWSDYIPLRTQFADD